MTVLAPTADGLRSQAAAGVVCVEAGMVLFVVQDGLMKSLLGEFTVWMLIFTRSIVTVLVLTAVSLVLMHLMDWWVLRSGRQRQAEPRPGRVRVVLRKARVFGFWFLLILGHALCLTIGKPSNEFIYFQF